jgi:hypothetical protein
MNAESKANGDGRFLAVEVSVDHGTMSSMELERILGQSPDERWEAGEPFRHGSVNRRPEQRYRFSRWAVVERGASIYSLDEVVANLIKRISPIESRFAELPRDATVALTLFVTEINTVLGFGIDSDTVRFIAAIGASIEVSLVTTPDRDQTT